MQYRFSVHAAIKHLFKERVLRTNLPQPQSSEIIFRRCNELGPSKGTKLNQLNKDLYDILELTGGSLHRIHLDQTFYIPYLIFPC